MAKPPTHTQACNVLTCWEGVLCGVNFLCCRVKYCTASGFSWGTNSPFIFMTVLPMGNVVLNYNISIHNMIFRNCFISPWTACLLNTSCESHRTLKWLIVAGLCPWFLQYVMKDQWCQYRVSYLTIIRRNTYLFSCACGFSEESCCAKMPKHCCPWLWSSISEHLSGSPSFWAYQQWSGVCKSKCIQLYETDRLGSWPCKWKRRNSKVRMTVRKFAKEKNQQGSTQ